MGRGMPSNRLTDSVLQVSQAPDETLFCTGDMSESGLYIVVEGSLNIFCQDGEQRVLTNTLKPGESVGEMDLLDGMLYPHPHDHDITLQKLGVGVECHMTVRCSKCLCIETHASIQ